MSKLSEILHYDVFMLKYCEKTATRLSRTQMYYTIFMFFFFNRRITCRSVEERREAASQIESEANQIAQLFNTLAGLPEFVS